MQKLNARLQRAVLVTWTLAEPAAKKPTPTEAEPTPVTDEKKETEGEPEKAADDKAPEEKTDEKEGEKKDEPVVESVAAEKKVRLPRTPLMAALLLASMAWTPHSPDTLGSLAVPDVAGGRGEEGRAGRGEGGRREARARRQGRRGGAGGQEAHADQGRGRREGGRGEGRGQVDTRKHRLM